MSIKIQLIIAYLFLLLGGVLQNSAIQAVGCLFILGLVIIKPVDKALLYIMAMVPNAAAFTISAVGSNFIGVSFLIVLLKILGSNSRWKFSITPFILLSAIYLVILSGTRVLSGNFYDFALVCQVMIVLLAWRSVLKSLDINTAIEMVKSFRFGCILTLVGMVVSYPLAEEKIGRFKALLDDCNYTGGVFAVLMGICILTYCFKLPIRNNIKYMFFALLGGMMTGSRGFMFAVAVLFFILLLTRSFGKKSSKIVFAGLVLACIFYGLYLAGFGPVVTVCDNTIGRTLNLNESHQDGQFMDATSGRTLLWAYYMDMALKDNSIFYFGRGFNNYYSIENGGYGLAAHNIFVSSIIGLGLIGTIIIILLYISLARNGAKIINFRTACAFMSLALSLTACYFFLDGILETRFISYIALAVILIHIYEYCQRHLGTSN